MNLIPLAALLVAALAFATSVTAIVLVERLRRSRPSQRQSSGPHSVQVQAGGIVVHETDLGRRERIAREAAERIVKMGRHL